MPYDSPHPASSPQPVSWLRSGSEPLIFNGWDPNLNYDYTPRRLSTGHDVGLMKLCRISAAKITVERTLHVH